MTGTGDIAPPAPPAAPHVAAASPTEPSGGPLRPLALTLGFASLYLATFDSDMGSPDEFQRYALAVKLAREGFGALPGSGHVSRFPPLQSMVASLPMKLGLLLDHGQDGDWTHRLGLAVSLVTCIGLIPLFYWLGRNLGLTARRAAGVTALFGLTNPVWPYAKRFFSEPLTAFLALLAIAGAFDYVRKGRRASLAVALAAFALMPLNNMIVPAGIGLALFALLWLEGRKRALVPLVLVGGAAAAFALWLTRVRHGDLAGFGYGGDLRFTFHVLDGLHGLLFGFGRSIFLFAPLLVLAIPGLPRLSRASRGLAVACAGSLVVELLIVASWWCWWGGICWGPRLVLPILPVALVPAFTFLAEPRRWKRPLMLLVGVWGFYVQFLGFSFKHDFDIYFWMKQYEVDERRSWFEWEYSVLRRMPRHFREQPWDISSSFKTLEQTGASTVELAGHTVKSVEIIHRGDALVFHWSIHEIRAVLKDGRTVSAGQLGARLETFNGQDGSGAIDGNPATRWDTGRKRLDGDWVRLVFPEPRSDLVRIELDHLPSDKDFPNALEARVKASEQAPEERVPAHAATPVSRWSPLIYLFALLGAGLVGASVAARVPGERARTPSA